MNTSSQMTIRRCLDNGSVNPFMRKLTRRGWCPYCHRALQHHLSSIDHILPRAAGGPRVWYNEAGVCRKCNGKKADSSLLHFLLGVRAGGNKPVLSLYALSDLPMGWKDPLATLGYVRTRPVISEYAGMGAKQRKVARQKLALSANL